MVLLYECLLLRSDQSFQCSGFSLRSIFLKSGNSNGRQKPSAFTYNEGTVLWFGLSVKPDCIEEKLSNANGVNAFSETHLMEPCYLLLLEFLRFVKPLTRDKMIEYPSPVRPRRDGNGNQVGSRNGTPARHQHRHAVEDESGDLIKCTGKSCKSCTAGLIADCVAVCCCPCAVVNILVFAFLKVPWMVGRRILKLGKKKGGNLERKRKCEMTNYLECAMDLDGISGKERVEQGASEFEFSGFREEDLKDNFSARFEAEELWFELHQFGHLGFGRVSFTGIPSLCKNN